MLPAIIAALLPVVGDQIATLIMGDSPAAPKIADAAVAVVPQVTGITVTDEHSARNAAQALTLDPAKAAEVQRLVNRHAVDVMAEETKRLAVVNETMRNEANSADPFVRRMRPFFGYIMALTWGMRMGASSWVIVADPGKAAGVLTGLGTVLTELATPALQAVQQVQSMADQAGAVVQQVQQLQGARDRRSHHRPAHRRRGAAGRRRRCHPAGRLRALPAGAGPPSGGVGGPRTPSVVLADGVRDCRKIFGKVSDGQC